MKKVYISLVVACLAHSSLSLANTNLTLDSLNAKDSGRVVLKSMKIVPADDKLLVSMCLNMDSLYLKSNQMLAYTPIVEDTIGNKMPLKPVLVMGRNQHYVYQRSGNRNYPEAIEVRRKNHTAQQYHYSCVIPLEPWMKEAWLNVAEDLCGCGDLLNQDRIPGMPVDYHPEKEILNVYMAPRVEANKIRVESGSAFLDFPVNKTDIRPTYRDNQRELEKIIATIDLVKNDSNTIITNIDIHGYASPEGSYSNNERLAKGRSIALKEYVSKLYDFPKGIFTVHYTPEDWVGLRKRVVASNQLAKKEEILATIDGSREPDNKDYALKTFYPTDYQYILNEIYPALRHSDYEVTYRVKAFDVEEAKQVFKTKPKQLSLNELFMVAQTYKPGSAEYNEVFETAVRLFPNDTVANLNAANVALDKGDLDQAASYLSKAGDSPAAIHARGVLAMRQKRFDEAETFLQEASAKGVSEAKKNLEILAKMKSLQ